MNRKINNIVSVVLLLVFLFPSVIVLTHHHEHIICNSGDSNHSQKIKEKCAVCDYHFITISSELNNLLPENEFTGVLYKNFYHFIHTASPSLFSFLLRAPPFNKC